MFDFREKGSLQKDVPFPLMAILPLGTKAAVLVNTAKGICNLSSRALLENYVTNLDDQVFAIHGLEGIIGAVMARYSRAETGLRDTLLREFIKEDKLNVKKAYKLIERVLIAYGDDSVGELEGAHLSFENISMLATKVIEHRRIGGSPIEQSTRYVRYDFRNENQEYHYYTPKDFPDPKLRQEYIDSMDFIFDQYALMWSRLMPFLEQSKPIEDAVYDLGEAGQRLADMATPKLIKSFEKTYKNDLKTKACDILRAFLPLATKANVGLFGNGRFFQHLISKMLTSPLGEANHLGERAFEELTKVIPHYVKRAKKMTYLANIQDQMAELGKKYFGDLEANTNSNLDLLEPDYLWQAARIQQLGGSSASTLRQAEQEAAHIDFIAAMIYSYVRAPFSAIRKRLRELPSETRELLFSTYYGDRKARRDRPERGIEHGYPYTFDLVTEWAVYKDLMRHRMATIQLQPMKPDLGFEMPWEIDAAGLTDIAQQTVARAEALFESLAKHYPSAREYAVMQGHKVRWLIGLNDRALMHMLELRTALQGHPNYRKTCQDMHRAAEKLYPQRMQQLKYVNHDQAYWSRSDSEARQRVKEAQLEDGES